LQNISADLAKHSSVLTTCWIQVVVKCKTKDLQTNRASYKSRQGSEIGLLDTRRASETTFTLP